MGTCYVCESQITGENYSREHVIANAIGGRLRSDKLLCHSCNCEFGERIDAELCRQLHPLSHLLDVSRQRGETPPLRFELLDTGETVLVETDGVGHRARPHVEVTEEGEEVFLNIQARSREEARKLLNGLKRRYPQLDVEAALTAAVEESHRPDSLARVRISFGGAEVARAVCKSAVNLYMLRGGSREIIQHLIPFIRGMADESYVGYADAALENRTPDDLICHRVTIFGDGAAGLLYAEVEYFSCLRLIVLLCDRYEGPRCFASYCIDCISGTEVELTASDPLARDEALRQVGNFNPDLDDLDARIGRVMERIEARQRVICDSQTPPGDGLQGRVR